MTIYKQGEQPFDPKDFAKQALAEQKHQLEPAQLEVRAVEALNSLAANIAALALAIDSYVQSRKQSLPPEQQIDKDVIEYGK